MGTQDVEALGTVVCQLASVIGVIVSTGSGQFFFLIRVQVIYRICGAWWLH